MWKEEPFSLLSRCFFGGRREGRLCVEHGPFFLASCSPLSLRGLSALFRALPLSYLPLGPVGGKFAAAVVSAVASGLLLPLHVSVPLLLLLLDRCRREQKKILCTVHLDRGTRNSVGRGDNDADARPAGTECVREEIYARENERKA